MIVLLSLTSMRRMDLFMILKSNLLAVRWQLVTRHFWPRFNISEILSAAVSFCNNFYEHFRWTLCSSGRKWARTFSRMPFLGSGKNYLLTCCELTLHLLIEGETSHPEIHKVRKVLSVSMRKEAVVRSDLTYRFDIYTRLYEHTMINY